MYTSTTEHRREAMSSRSLLCSMILFALALIGLYYGALRLGVRVPYSIAAEYFALASDLTPVLHQGVHDAARSTGADKRSLVDAGSLTGWTGTRVDLIFGSHSQLRAGAEVQVCAEPTRCQTLKAVPARWSTLSRRCCRSG